MRLFECIRNNDPTVKISSDTITMEAEAHSQEQEPKTSQQTSLSKRSLLILLSVMIMRSVERICGLWGLQVARHPVLAVVGSLILVTFLGSGLARLNLVFRPYDLWVPQKSEFSEVNAWKIKNFPRLYREQIAIWEGENVLSAPSIREMFDFHHEVERIKISLGNKTVGWTDVCVQISNEDAPKDKSHLCYETSILEVWGYNSEAFGNFTDESILRDLNSVNVSKVFGRPLDFSYYLGGVTKDEFGNIIKAKTAIHSWLTIINNDNIQKGEYEMDVGTGEKVDLAGMEWEKVLVNVGNNWNGDLRINVRAGHTLGHVLHNAITRDAVWIGVGWSVLLIYILFTLGKPLKYDQRLIPACIGLLAIGMAVLSANGACSLFGIPYGTLTNVLPVLLVALGVDDMYVIVTNWDGFEHIDSVEYRAKRAMKKAGMAITVTSVTDILAFLVGTSTSLPGLRWFCIYSAVGIAMVYFLQATLFVAALVVNQKWIDSRKLKRNSQFCNSKLPKCKFKFGVQSCMNLWAKCLSFHVTKVAVFILTCSMFLYSMINIAQLSREFDTMWLIPESSSLYKWYNTVENTFPQSNEKGVVLFKGVKFPEDMIKLKRLSQKLSALPEVLDVEAWFNEVNLDELFEKHFWLKSLSPLKQCKLLLKYISFANRRHFRVNLNVHEENDQRNKTSNEHPCSTFQIEFQYVPPKTYEAKQASMQKIREIVKETEIEGYKAVWAHVYGQWETDKIILEDLFKSLCIVLSAVAVITVILLASLRASLFVLLCVIGTLVNVASSIYLWGLTVNTVTGIALVLAIGICVDYAAHIAHDFLVATGTKIERVHAALLHMGSAVFHGGASTCLTFILLAPSDNYIYVSYFKILTSVSFFGLYHALIFLPALLSLFGPDSHPKWSENNYENQFTPTAINQTLEITRRKSRSTAYTINLPLPFDPPPYTHTVDPPLYRKSNSLPSLSLFLSETGMKDNALHTPSSSSTDSSQRSFRHSTCCTKL